MLNWNRRETIERQIRPLPPVPVIMESHLENAGCATKSLIHFKILILSMFFRGILFLFFLKNGALPFVTEMPSINHHWTAVYKMDGEIKYVS